MTLPHGSERGAISLEALMVGPALMMVLALVIVFGRAGLADVTVDSAAQNGARAASIERDPSSARQAATTAISSTLDQRGLECASRTEEIDVTQIGKAAGEAGTVHVRLVCDVPLDPFPGSRTVTADGNSAVDTYREGQ